MSEQKIVGEARPEAGHSPADGVPLQAVAGDASANWAHQSEADEVLAALIEKAGKSPEIEEFVLRPRSPLLVVLTGPSGVGKDVTLQRMEHLGIKFHYVVTCTTRRMRAGEVNHRHYHFVTEKEYRRMLENGELLEHAEVFGNSYGIPKSEVIDPLLKGEDVIMKPDVQGAAHIRELEPEAVFIFLAPPSMEEQARRLYYRKTEDPQELARRLEVARQEMHELTHFDYVVVNHNNRLDDTVRTIEAIMRAEKCRVHPRRIRLAERG